MLVSLQFYIILLLPSEKSGSNSSSKYIDVLQTNDVGIF